MGRLRPIACWHRCPCNNKHDDEYNNDTAHSHDSADGEYFGTAKPGSDNVNDSEYVNNCRRFNHKHYDNKC